MKSPPKEEIEPTSNAPPDFLESIQGRKRQLTDEDKARLKVSVDNRYHDKVAADGSIVLCELQGATEEDEVTLFAIQTGISTYLTAGERLRANLVAGNPDALYFVGVTSNAGVELVGPRSDKLRIERFMGYTTKTEMLRIDMALLVSLALNVLAGNRSE